MPLLARVVNGALWAKFADDAHWKKPDFPYELLPDLIDRSGGGLSFWEVKSSVDPALKRIAAALLAGTEKAPGREIKSVEFRLVEPARVMNLGISISATDGDTRDDQINKLHRELKDLNSARAIALLRLMTRRAKLFSANESAKFIATSLVQKHLQSDVLKKDFLHALHQKSAIRVVIP